MAPSVEPPTVDFGSGVDLRVMRSRAAWGFALGVEPAYHSLAPSPTSPPHSHKSSLSLSKLN